MSNVELIEELERWYQDGSDEWFQRILRRCRDIVVEADKVETLEAKIERLRAFIANSLPFLDEAWAACFNGQEQRMLSAEQRGMRALILSFREIAAGKPCLPPGVVTMEDAQKQVEKAVEWAHKMLGDPNELKPELREWMGLGETCATGLERANAEVERLRAEIGDLQDTVVRRAIESIGAVEQRHMEIEELKAENRKLLEEYVLDAFEQACTTKDGRYDHCCISTWEDAQELLLRHGLIKPEQCVRREDAV